MIQIELQNLLNGIDYEFIKKGSSTNVENISFDSRSIKKNGLFIAIKGFEVDGHNFINDAIKNGANTLIVSDDINTSIDVNIIKVNNTREILSKLSANYYSDPTEKLNLIGITGTNGKTSIAYFIKSIFEKANKKIGLIGTNEINLNNKIIKSKNTTPEALDLQRIFKEALNLEIGHMVMEVSSHALELKRVDSNTKFNIGIYTNLSPDHLELHGSMDNYFKAKLKLFYLTNDFNIINIDDEYGEKIVNKANEFKSKLITYGIDNKADIRAEILQITKEFSIVKVIAFNDEFSLRINIPSKIYIYNALAAIACGYALNMDLNSIKLGIESVSGIRGRIEEVKINKDYKVFIDFAHTEDGLKNILNTVRTFTENRIILVFGVYGSAGSKRVKMGKVASEYADFSIITSDNPKREDPLKIIDEISVEMDDKKFKKIIDRKEAIHYALSIARKGDIVLLAGKGHESTQKIGDKEIPFSERDIVLEYSNIGG